MPDPDYERAEVKIVQGCFYVIKRFFKWAFWIVIGIVVAIGIAFVIALKT